jgi:hypothetical protein
VGSTPFKPTRRVTRGSLLFLRWIRLLSKSGMWGDLRSHSLVSRLFDDTDRVVLFWRHLLFYGLTVQTEMNLMERSLDLLSERRRVQIVKVTDSIYVRQHESTQARQGNRNLVNLAVTLVFFPSASSHCPAEFTLKKYSTTSTEFFLCSDCDQNNTRSECWCRMCSPSSTSSPRVGGEDATFSCHYLSPEVRHGAYLVDHF